MNLSNLPSVQGFAGILYGEQKNGVPKGSKLEPAANVAEGHGRTATIRAIRRVGLQFPQISVRLHSLLLLPVGSGITEHS